MGLSRSEQLVLVLLSIAILAGRFARGCGEQSEFELIRSVAGGDSADVRSEALEGAGSEPSASAVNVDSARSVSAKLAAANDSAAASSSAGSSARTSGALTARQATTSAASSTSAASTARPIDLNRATLDELMTLPGIGPAKAKAIVERREAMNGFRAIDDLLDVPGIGPKTLERLATLVRVNGAPEEKR